MWHGCGIYGYLDALSFFLDLAVSRVAVRYEVGLANLEEETHMRNGGRGLWKAVGSLCQRDLGNTRSQPIWAYESKHLDQTICGQHQSVLS